MFSCNILTGEGHRIKSNESNQKCLKRSATPSLFLPLSNLNSNLKLINLMMKTNTGLALFAATLPLGSVLANPAAPTAPTAPAAPAAPAEETSSKGNHHINASGTPRPNIVHIMIDDLGWQDIASHTWTA
jgi:hypothetical protein